MNHISSITCLLPIKLREYIETVINNYTDFQELRMRTGRPMGIRYGNNFYYIDKKTRKVTEKNTNAVVITINDIKETMEHVSNYSLYAFENELKQGFITVQGGHRVGICGKVVMEHNEIKTIKNIASINIRIAHEIIGCSDRIVPYIHTPDGKVHNTIIISPPCCGKTTLLRDIIRNLSYGCADVRPHNIGVVDERSELAACYNGIPNADIGERTDVLDCCTKSVGMMMMIRAMSPEVIAVDEIGLASDIEAIKYASVCGCRILCSIHAVDIDELKEKPFFYQMIMDKYFKRYIIMDSDNCIGSVKAVYNENLELMERNQC